MAAKSNAEAFTKASTRPRTSVRAAPAPPPPGVSERRKYTLRLDGPAADAFDSAVLSLGPEVGRRVDKNETLAVLTDLLATDPAVAAKVAKALRLA